MSISNLPAGFERRREDHALITGHSQLSGPYQLADIESQVIAAFTNKVPTAAYVNAVLDALAPLGIKSIDIPLRPEKLSVLILPFCQTTVRSFPSCSGLSC